VRNRSREIKEDGDLKKQPEEIIAEVLMSFSDRNSDAAWAYARSVGELSIQSLRENGYMIEPVEATDLSLSSPH
jgi:hypothetical protein